MPMRGQPAGQRRADAGQQADRLGCEQQRRLGAEHAEAARLVAPGGDLGQQAVGGQADRDGDADLALDSRAKRASTAAGGAPCSASVPARSSTASSIDSGCTSGVRRSIRARIWRPTAAYLAKSGRMTTASGQAFSALNIGMALRTPWMRAM